MLKKTTLIAIMLVIITIQPTATEPEVKFITKIIAPKHDNKKLAQTLASAGYGWNGKQWKCLNRIIENESHFNHKANNKRSSAYGLMQMLGETSKDPTIQLLHGYKYLRHRYETPCKAWKFHQRNHYY